MGSLKAGIKIEKGEPLFNRYDIEKEIGASTEENKKQVNPPKEDKHKPNIEKEDFDKLELLTAKILVAEKVENADKLLKFVLDIGEGEQRVVVSSIAEYYKPEEMVGKTVLYLANLKPKKFRGVTSHGMLLLADNGKTLSLMTTEKGFDAGCAVN
ncbi:methionine--tRNA ligase subunit beta [Brachyspira hyodysenteriae]|nr:methionine--tRNA ligase subunit beta [Brachyspira hyodysenteriae]MCZ9901047.1 methionine--tRNA ligase subunit beta [Brachyspira hyodysenteriae]